MEHKKANSKIQYAVDSGKLIRPKKCEICGSEGKPDMTNCKNPWTGEPLPDIPAYCPIVAHHPNYNNPLYVIWVCRKCHIKIHKIFLPEE